MTSRRIAPVRTLLILVFCSFLASLVVAAQAPAPTFGGSFSALDARRQALVKDWVARFVETTGQKVEAGPFYDEIVGVSTKTTFEAVTHALMTTKLTDVAGASLGDALGLVERLDAVRGEVTGARGDRQFRMYVRLTPGAVETLRRSREFKRVADNTVYHKGYPHNYREQGGTPSMQISVALDGRRADIDVDYRGSSFPVALFNGHLSASNSDIRAGNNYHKHVNRWSGFQDWWHSFFGVRQQLEPAAGSTKGSLGLPSTPRAGNQNVDAMTADFLKAWLVEGDIVAAMGYLSERSYACLAQDGEDPAAFDRGMAPFGLMLRLKAAHDTVGPRSSLVGTVVGARVVRPELRVVKQPNHAQFVVYEVPDDVAAAFDCEAGLEPAGAKPAKREYGHFYGATFNVGGQRDTPVALLWAKDGGFWKIVSWKVGADDATPDAPPVATAAAARADADPGLAAAAHGFVDEWLVRREYDAAFGRISPKAYACYDLERDASKPAATSPEDAGRKLRASLEAVGTALPAGSTLDTLLIAAEPVHPATRILNHSDARLYSLTSPPNALADAAECAARAAGAPIPDPLPLEYGQGFGMTLRFKTHGGEGAVLRLLWRKEADAWRITSYGVELP
jgi:hypothetical protein